jgi:ActR/RegA family two-component response regulator
MTLAESTKMHVLLVGADAALLEGLSQSFAALGYAPRVAITLHDARESAALTPPVLAVVDRRLAGDASADTLAIKLRPGGAMVMYHGPNDSRPAMPAALLRAVMADLTLPLERNRLMALAQHVQGRIRTTGRGSRTTPPEGQVNA